MSFTWRDVGLAYLMVSLLYRMVPGFCSCCCTELEMQSLTWTCNTVVEHLPRVCEALGYILVPKLQQGNQVSYAKCRHKEELFSTRNKSTTLKNFLKFLFVLLGKGQSKGTPSSAIMLPGMLSSRLHRGKLEELLFNPTENY